MTERERIAKVFDKIRDACLDAYDACNDDEQNDAYNDAAQAARHSIIVQRMLTAILERRGIHDALWERAREKYPSKKAFYAAMARASFRL